MDKSSRGMTIAVVALAIIAVAAIVVAIVSMTGNHDGMMGDGSVASAESMHSGHMGSGDGMAMSDQAFIAMMVPHHQMALDMAKVELARGKDPQVKAFAKKVIAAQSKEIAEMRDWYRQWYGGDMPDMPMSGSGHMAMMGMDMDMQSLQSTDEPDRTFLTMMLPHHAGAVTMSSVAVAGPNHARVQQLKKEIIAAQSTEMGQMQQMRQRIAPPLG